MDRIQCQSKPLDFRLRYFSSWKLLTKAKHYTLSPSLSGEIKHRNRKAQQFHLDCDCACLGQK